MKVAYLGPAGTFGEQAALVLAPHDERLPYASHSAVARAVEQGEAAAGVMAIENSIQGSVIETLDALIHETRTLVMQAEAVLPIEHHLVAAPGVAVADVRVIYAHPQALGQSRKYIEANFPEARLEAALSNAASVEMALQHGKDAAAIATASAAARAGAAFLARGIQDRNDNLTRFVLVGKEAVAPTGRDRTSIAFWLAHRPGTLAGVLEALAARGVNCLKIESRPIWSSFGEYLFLLDFEGHAAEEPGRSALQAIRGLCSEVRVFGSYPRARQG